jgi:hypothetical protein
VSGLTVLHLAKDAPGPLSHSGLTVLHLAKDAPGPLSHSGLTVLHLATDAPGPISHNGLTVLHLAKDAPGPLSHSGLTVLHLATDAPGPLSHSGLTVLHLAKDAPGPLSHNGLTVLHLATDAPGPLSHSGLTVLHLATDAPGPLSHTRPITCGTDYVMLICWWRPDVSNDRHCTLLKVTHLNLNLTACEKLVETLLAFRHLTLWSDFTDSRTGRSLLYVAHSHINFVNYTNITHDGQCTYNVTLRCVRGTTFAVEKP